MLLVEEIVSMLRYRIRDDAKLDGDGDVDSSEILWDGWFDLHRMKTAK